MKRKSVCKTLILTACVVLMQSMIAFADEPQVTDETVGVETVESVEVEETLETESVESETTEVAEETLEIETEVVEEETEVPEEPVTPADTPRIMYGTVTDTLYAPGDYKIYPVPCLQNMYLQAELFIDTNARVDYDLYLIDENFNIITGCDYLANNNGGKRYLTENIGFVNTEPDRYYYLFVFPSYFEGTEPKEFTLDYGLTSVIGDNEPAEHAADATPVAITPGVTNTITGTLNSAIDNDWYVFLMPEDDGTDLLSGIHIETSCSSETNGIWIETYSRTIPFDDGRSMMSLERENLSSNPINIGLAPGQLVYLRVFSNKSINDYDITSAPDYSISISTVKRPDTGAIWSVNGNSGFIVQRSAKDVSVVGQVSLNKGMKMGPGVKDVDLIIEWRSQTGETGSVHTTTDENGIFRAGFWKPRVLGLDIEGNTYFDNCEITVY